MGNRSKLVKMQMVNPIPIVESRSRARFMTFSARKPDTTTRLKVRMKIMAAYSYLLLMVGTYRKYAAAAPARDECYFILLD